MAFRDLVTGGQGCGVPGEGSSSANPLGSLANSLLGSAAKTQERVRELPSLARPGGVPSGRIFEGSLEGPQGLPGAEIAGPSHGLPPPQFLESFHGAGPAGFEEAWGDAAIAGPARGMPGLQHRAGPSRPMLPEDQAAHFEEFERIYGGGAGASAGPVIPGPANPALEGAIRSFFDISRGPAPFVPLQHQQIPPLPLSEGEAARLRNRSSILARHVFAGQGEGFADAQVNTFLHSLGVEAGAPARLGVEATFRGRFQDFEGAWNEAAVGPAAAKGGLAPWERQMPGGAWAEEFHQQMGKANGAPGAGWAEEFEQQGLGAPGGAWAEEFGQDMAARSGNLAMQGQPVARQAQRLADALARDADPKFQKSEFLRFMSKMGKGEVVVEDGALKPGTGAAAEGGAAWAEEFDALHHHQHQQVARPDWADEFLNEPALRAGGPSTAADWADEFGDQMARGFAEDAADDDAGGWLDSYNRFVEEQLKGELDLRGGPGSTRWSYTFADQNPYVGHPEPFQEGRQLFERGLLSEAVLALEAEVLKNDSNSDAWHLLGVAHAENDDDRQAIAAMTRAREANPTNLNVLLALGVSHTNELEQAEALSHLRNWLQNNPKYSSLLPPPMEGAAPPALSHSDIVQLFTEAARMSPEDPELQEVLGVLFNLSREFGRAKEAFRKALELRPESYVLWNRLGATQANNAESAPAIEAYQKALDLKPNYVRAWTNMGIAFANQGKYDESVRFYVRALSMNPSAENAWQYLRIALSGANRQDAWGMCDRRDIDALQKEFPL